MAVGSECKGVGIGQPVTYMHFGTFSEYMVSSARCTCLSFKHLTSFYFKVISIFPFINTFTVIVTANQNKDSIRCVAASTC